MKLPKHKCSLTITHNEHKDYYQTAKDEIEKWDDPEMNYLIEWSSPESKQKAIETDEIWCMTWYPNTPIGFYSIATSNLEELLEFSNKYSEEQ